VVRATGGAGVTPKGARPPRAPTAAAAAAAQVVRESMCGLVYSKDDLTEDMRGKLKQEFKLPGQDPSKIQMFNPDLRRKSLGISKKPGTWTPVPYVAPALLPTVDGAMPVEDEYKFEELVLWRPPTPEEQAAAAAATAEAAAAAAAAAPDGAAAPAEGAAYAAAAAPDAATVAPPPPLPSTATPIVVDGFLCRWLREHQREGTQFLFDCCMGLRDYDGEGCILADDMGCV